MTKSNQPISEIILYQREDGQTKLEVRLENETVWLTQQQLANLLQTSKQNISLHIRNIYEEGELTAEATVKDFLTVQIEGTRQVKRRLDYYNLDMIISVGYRVKSHIATHFRQWATHHLREYLIKGFLMDDERLKEREQANYFEELLARIRDIRSSEKVFWRKVLDIYATSIDYDAKTETSRHFFAVMQNKMHWATHGHTAAEIVNQRVNADEPNMGLTSWSGEKIRKADVSIAKNYLNREELDILNRIVTAYLEFAELQAKNRKPMYMNDWIAKLDDFLQISDRDILIHAGKISHQRALEKSHAEYEKYRQERINAPSPVEEHFLEAINEIKEIDKTRKQK